MIKTANRYIAFVLLWSSLPGLINAVDVDFVLAFSISYFNTNGDRLRQPDSNLLDLATAIQAINDYNNKTGPVVPLLSQSNNECDLSIKYRVVDSGSSFSKLIKQYNYYKGKQVAPQFIIGPVRSETTIPLSFTSSADEVSIMGFSATSTALDAEDSHPYFSRVIPSDEALALSVIRLLQRMKLAQAALFYVDDFYGRSFRDAAVALATDFNIYISFVPFKTQTIRKGLTKIQKSKLNVVIGVILEEDMKQVLETADELDLTGPGKLWIFSDSLNEKDSLRLAKESESFARSLEGSIRVSPFLASNSNNIGQNLVSFTVAEKIKEHLPGGREYFDYMEAENSQEFNNSFSNAINESLFLRSGSENVYQVYDAVIAAALAVHKTCRNLTSRTKAEDIKNAIQNINFNGLSGSVSFLENGSRDPSSMKFPAVSFFRNDKGEIDVRLAGEYKVGDKDWTLRSDLTFSGGSKQIPLFTDPARKNENNIEPALLSIGHVLGTIVILLTIILGVWTMLHSAQPVIVAAQPVFLYIILFGVFISVLSVFVAGNDLDNVSFCVGPYWLISIGLTLIVSAMIAKLYRIHRLFNNKTFAELSHLNSAFIVKKIAAVTLVNIVLLLLWSFAAEMKKVEVVISQDEFDQVTESFDTCESKQENVTMAFGIILILFHLSQYFLAGFLAFQIRNVPADFQETTWIAISAFSQLQLILLGMPILIGIDPKERGIRYICQAILVSLVNVVFILLLYYPKMSRLGFDTGFSTVLVWLKIKENNDSRIRQLRLQPSSETNLQLSSPTL